MGGTAEVLSNIAWGIDGRGVGSAADAAATLTALSGESLSEAAEALIKTDAQGAAPTTTSGGLAWEGLASGYYVIIDVQPESEGDEDSDEYYSRAVVQILGADVTVHQKAESVPHPKKTANKETADLGDPIEYTLSAELKNIEAYTEYTLIFKDTMSKGLTYNGNAVLSIGNYTFTGSDTESGVTFDVAPGENSSTVLTITIDDVKTLGASSGDIITVTYTASINEDAIIATGVPNTLELGYSEDPDSDEFGWTIPIQKIVYTGSITVVKYADSLDGDYLDGAGFVLMNANGQYYKGIKDVPVDSTVENSQTYKAAQWGSESDALVLYSDANGQLVDASGNEAIFEGLAEGTYTLVETVTPAGYNTVNGDGKIEVTLSLEDLEEGNLYVASMEASEDVVNVSGTTLPSTGGMGTTLLYAVGGSLVVVAAGIMIYKKTRPQEA